MSSQLVIGHRGASGHRPEHSAAAYRLALRLGADSVEPDLVPTRDGVLVCRHDLGLRRTTDVASRPEFRRRRQVLVVDGEPRRDWFVHDFTAEELRTLRCRERWPRRRPTSAVYDGIDPILTLEELRRLVAAESARQGRRLQIHAEIKQAPLFRSMGLDVTDLVSASLPGLTWMSFDDVVLRRLAARGAPRLVQLREDRPRGRELGSISDYATGVGVRWWAVLEEKSLRPNSWVDKAGRRNLDVLVWTHRAENKHLPSQLRVGDDPRRHGEAHRAAALLWRAGIRGLISDFPEIAAAARPSRAVVRAS